jgi:DNA-binding response OmpR family regulator
MHLQSFVSKLNRVNSRYSSSAFRVYVGRRVRESVKKIIIVDDEPDIRLALRVALMARAFEVAEAGDGQAALGMLITERPDVVLLDVGMPDEDGLQVCRWIRAKSDVRIIVISAGGVERAAALSAGADDFIRKPFSIEELVSRIQALV